MSELAGQSAVVTGASSGIGRAIALQLAAAGADCLIHARQNREGLAAVEAEIHRLGRETKSVTTDLAEPAEQDALVEQAFHWRRKIDIWINNAGADTLTGPAASWSFEQKLQTLWQVDVLATIRLSRAAGARMQAGGVILNMSWDQVECGMAGDSGEIFAATKGAIAAFSRSLARSLAPAVRVNCLAPGWIKTAWGEQASDAWQQRAAGESLLKRWGTPEDVAAVARFLVSHAATFITGQMITINGGRA
ncbi:MAG TPA: SDR family oxidoreductase [Pirellulales bacterium]|nr:SDR family oxidoreductase [Pirellulales bacterium]